MKDICFVYKYYLCGVHEYILFIPVYLFYTKTNFLNES